MTSEQFHNLVLFLQKSTQSPETPMDWSPTFDGLLQFPNPTISVHREVIERFRWEHALLLSFAAAVMDCDLKEVTPMKCMAHLVSLEAQAHQKSSTN